MMPLSSVQQPAQRSSQVLAMKGREVSVRLIQGCAVDGKRNQGRGKLLLGPSRTKII